MGSFICRYFPALLATDGRSKLQVASVGASVVIFGFICWSYGPQHVRWGWSPPEVDEGEISASHASDIKSLDNREVEALEVLRWEKEKLRAAQPSAATHTTAAAPTGIPPQAETASPVLDALTAFVQHAPPAGPVSMTAMQNAAYSPAGPMSQGGAAAAAAMAATPPHKPAGTLPSAHSPGYDGPLWAPFPKVRRSRSRQGPC